jgi:N-methylhydantoinase A/oxoprolinase/acetone carboxylase beta subunit
VIEVGVDIGGTFTDVVWRGGQGRGGIVKIPSTPAQPGAAVLQAITDLSGASGVSAEEIGRFVHGTTIATDAVLERKGAKVGLITTEGFRDVLEIGRQWRQAMYHVVLEPETPVFVAPRARRLEVPERIGSQGEIVRTLDEAAVVRAADALASEGVESIAVCFLFSFLNPDHEHRARALIQARHPGLATSLSSDVDPAFREYERTAVTAFDAYIKPVVDQYLSALEADLATAGVSAPLQIMHSRGGITGAAVARTRPVRLFLSGPAAGVIGGRSVAEQARRQDVITVDIGGTSSDIALVHGGQAVLRAEGVIGGFPVRVPMVDINTIGAGGGSIAWLDDAGGLRVGPESAGSDPGPACYGRGGARPTVTDASVVLGYINPDYFAAGALALDGDRSRAAIEHTIAKPLNLSIEEAALGIHRVVNAQMSEGIRLVSIRQGYDPRDFALVPFGGAGPVHATALARELGISEIIVPPHPGVLSAAGLLAAAVEHEASMAFPRRLQGLPLTEIAAALEKLDNQCAALMEQDEVPLADRTTRYVADMCYEGQSYLLETPLDLGRAEPIDALYTAFRNVHERVHGHSTEAPAMIANLRAIHRGPGGQVPMSAAEAGTPVGAAQAREIWFIGATAGVSADVRHRSSLGPGEALEGPAIIEQDDTTIVVEPEWRATVDGDDTLWLVLKESS